MGTQPIGILEDPNLSHKQRPSKLKHWEVTDISQSDNIQTNTAHKDMVSRKSGWHRETLHKTAIHTQVQDWEKLTQPRAHHTYLTTAFRFNVCIYTWTVNKYGNVTWVQCDKQNNGWRYFSFCCNWSEGVWGACVACPTDAMRVLRTRTPGLLQSRLLTPEMCYKTLGPHKQSGDRPTIGVN